MTQQNFETDWARLRPRVQEHWPQLSERDIDRIEGRVERLYRLLCSRGGLSRSDAATQIWEFLHDSRGSRTLCPH